MMTIHAAGGPAMLAAARAARDETAAIAGRHTMLLAVTVLTSFDDADLDAVGQDVPAARQVRRLATLARDNGFDGAICSPREIAMLRSECGPDFKLVVPGIRPAGADAGDQKRTMTPDEAMAVGADFLVIGRPITGADDPADAARRIAETCTGERAS
jgi:orotidine-5'-phosphate decarboxylase